MNFNEIDGENKIKQKLSSWIKTILFAIHNEFLPFYQHRREMFLELCQ